MEHLTAITQDEANSLRKKEVASKYPGTNLEDSSIHSNHCMNVQVNVFICNLYTVHVV